MIFLVQVKSWKRRYLKLDMFKFCYYEKETVSLASLSEVVCDIGSLLSLVTLCSLILVILSNGGAIQVPKVGAISSEICNRFFFPG